MKEQSEFNSRLAPLFPKSRYAVFLGLGFLGAAVDLVSKELVFAWRGLPGEQEPYWIVDGYVGIETAVNIGALFGLGSGFGKVFAAFSVIAGIGIIIWLFRYRAASSLWLTFTMGLVLAGILGNLYDRLGFWFDPATMRPEWSSGVRDWILFRYQQYTWPNFNIADSCLVIGAAMLAWHSFTAPDEHVSKG